MIRITATAILLSSQNTKNHRLFQYVQSLCFMQRSWIPERKRWEQKRARRWVSSGWCTVHSKRSRPYGDPLRQQQITLKLPEIHPGDNSRLKTNCSRPIA